jgi:hypothetical protein
MVDPVVATPAAPAQETPVAVPAAPVAPPPTTPAPTLLTPGEQPKDGAAKAAEPAPEEFVVKTPEGFKIEKSQFDKFTSIAKESGLKSEGAQKLFDHYIEMQKQAGEQQVETITKWAEEAKTDAEIGNANWDKSLVGAQRVMDKLATPELRSLLSVTGLGNHKEVIRLLSKVSAFVTEDKLPGGDGAAANADQDRQAALKEAFPNSPEMWGGKQ